MMALVDDEPIYGAIWAFGIGAVRIHWLIKFSASRIELLYKSQAQRPSVRNTISFGYC
jgi:hypothetical protein